MHDDGGGARDCLEGESGMCLVTFFNRYLLLFSIVVFLLSSLSLVPLVLPLV
jgi:hypothetical protein